MGMENNTTIHSWLVMRTSIGTLLTSVPMKFLDLIIRTSNTLTLKDTIRVIMILLTMMAMDLITILAVMAIMSTQGIQSVVRDLHGILLNSLLL